MKKLLLSLIAFAAISTCHATSMWDQVSNRCYMAKYRVNFSASAGSTSAVIVDLSDVVNWPHKTNGYVTIDAVRVDFDKAAASTGTIKVGVLTYVDYSSGTVTWFYTNENVLNVSNTDNDPDTSYSGFPLRCQVYPSTLQVAGQTPYIISSDKIGISDSEASVYKSSATVLPSPYSGGVTPGLGDIVMNLYKPIGTTVTAMIEIFYHTER